MGGLSVRVGRRSLVVSLVCCAMGLAISPVTALGEGSSPERPRSAEGAGASLWESSLLSEVEDLQTLEEAKQASPEASGTGSSSASTSSGTGSGTSPLEDRFVVPGPALLQGEQLEAERQARLASPEAVAARRESELEYSGLSGGAAAKVVGEAFPKLIAEAAGGPPKLAAGESIAHVPAANVAQIVDSSGKHSVIESAVPMAIKTAQGFVPINLDLTQEGESFEPKTPLVGVQMPKQLSQGVSLANTGMSLIPVDEHGSPLGGEEGSADGTSVIYTNTQTDESTLVKPTTTGFEMDSVLFSIDSPTQLYYRVVVPQGASLKEEGGMGAVAVMDEGATLARIDGPIATDAEGTMVPLSVKVLPGGIISVTLPSLGGGVYKLPIVVDPTVEDPVWSNGYYNYKTAWYFEHYGAGFGAPEHPEGGSWTEHIWYEHWNGEWGGLFYTTRGESQITIASVEGHWNDSGSNIANFVNLYAPKESNNTHTEDYDFMPETTEASGWGGYACAPVLNCPETKPGGAAEENNNTATYEQEAYGDGEGHGGENTLTRAYVDIKQEKGPELEFN